MKEIFLDTETTGLSFKDSHRIVEVACIETNGLVPTNNIFHKLINPERNVPEDAVKIHGFTSDFLKTKEKFKDIADAFVDFTKNKKIIIHNASFDLGFLNHELKLVLDLLDNNNQSYDVFEYGKYNNRDLIEAAKSYKFGIIINGTETQGFAIQEIMACNLPLLVWNKTVNYFNNLELSGTSVTVWDKHCGELVYNFEQLEKKYSYFVSNLKNYNPARLILEKLTFEKFNSNLKEMFKS